MSTSEKISLVRVSLESLAVHDEVPNEALISLASIEHALGNDQILSMDALRLLLWHHPVHAIQEGNWFHVVSGLRTFQLAKHRLPGVEEIPIFLHVERDHLDIPVVSAADIFLSHLLFGLDLPSCDLDLTRLWQGLDGDLKKVLTPQLKSKVGLARLLGRNRRHLSPKNDSPASELKAVLGQQAFDLDDT